jgi:Trk K+ transport system NAD-binding subunit
LAGATGDIGIGLAPLLVRLRHEVAGMLRTVAKTEQVLALGAQPVICDALDADTVCEAILAFVPELITGQPTDLPEDPAHIG